MSLSNKVYAELAAVVHARSLARNVSLAELGRWQIGGCADIFVAPRDVLELASALRIVTRSGMRHVVIGDGSNLLFADAGFRGVVIRIGRPFSGIAISSDGKVRAGAGLWAPAFVRRIINAGLDGATHAIGIPGSLGGLVAMNGGSDRRGIGEHVIAVEVMTPEGKLQRMDAEALHFGRRRSAILDNHLVVTSCEFAFKHGDSAALRRAALVILKKRRARFPSCRLNCGSVFVSDPELYSAIGPPGLAIESAGLKGKRFGGAQISKEHANFIINAGGATSSDVLFLIAEARGAVRDLTGIDMRAEVQYLDPRGQLRPAHEAAEAAALDRERAVRGLHYASG